MSEESNLALVVDSVNTPRDIADLVMIARATGADLYFSGNCIYPNHRKVSGIIESWSLPIPEFHSYETYEKAIIELRGKGYFLVGTSPQAEIEYHEIPTISGGRAKLAVVIGSSNGLSKSKLDQLDASVTIPMREGSFLTTYLAAAIILYSLMPKTETVKP
jgi:tRNA G18 (ribose-2'-O)-methylase SpoU